MQTVLPRTLILCAVVFAAAPVHAQEAALLHASPPRSEARQPLQLDATLVDGAKVLELFVRYRGPGEPYVQVSMERQYGDLYRAVIPAEHMVPPGVEYFVEAAMVNGERAPLFMSALRPARVMVGTQTAEPPPVRAPPVRKGTRDAPRSTPDIDAFAPPSGAGEDDDSGSAPTPPPPAGRPDGTGARTGTTDSRTSNRTDSVDSRPGASDPRASSTPSGTDPRASSRTGGADPRASNRTDASDPRASSRTDGTDSRAPSRTDGTDSRTARTDGSRAPTRTDTADPRASARTSGTDSRAPGRADGSNARASSSDDAMAALNADLPPEPRASSSPSAMDDDLALYSAEDVLAVTTLQEASVRTVPAIGASFNRAQMIALGARTVADVLDVVPGVSVSRDVQGFHRTAIRGLRNDAEVLFLLDGHRLNNFFDGKALMNLPVENLERIEVIRGPGSAVYGAGAFQGVVNLVTNHADGVRGAITTGGVPRDDGRLALATDGHLSAAHTTGDLRLFADLDLWTQEGDSLVIDHDALDDESVAQGLRDVDQPAGRTRDGRFLLNAGGGVSYGLDSAGRVGITARYLSEKRDALVGLFDTVGNDSQLSWDVLLADLTWERPLSDGGQVRARLGFDQQSTDRMFQLTPLEFRTGDGADRLFPEGLQEQTQVTVRTVTASVDADLALTKENHLTLGFVAEQQSLSQYDYTTNYTLDGRLRPSPAAPEGLVDLTKGAASRRLNLGLSAQDQWTVLSALTLTFGLRLDAIQLPDAEASGTLDASKMVVRVNPRVGLVIAASDALVLKALYGRAFRAPTPQELVERIPDTDYNQGRFEGNPLLKPTTVDTFELGMDLVQAAGDTRVRVRANAFLQNFASPITPVDTSGNIVPLRNRELGVRVYGVEAEARLEASKRAAAWVNASLSRAQDLEVPEQARLLTDVPQARFNAGVSMPLGDWVNLDVVVRSGAERRNNNRSTLELIRRYEIPAYSLITAQLRTEPIWEHFEVTLYAQNLFDHDLRDDVPRPDRVTGLLPREGVSGYLTLRAFY
ncbi:TonB-dependent receptor [Corallococcus exiguus]|uniref:TonB-dependent receptor plug domain-containing protein n=1 Tax=Corallococcus TaxID=83461 RepID=UPI000EC3CEAC|nr:MULTISPECIES: TonB-dependent receptor [Corallococcus]NNC19170.1 TonB-dependent receptor [Corallococcus exiguus]NRD52779.1 TonB-dependent receptor [Corallococcus exiguus]RKI19135.1 TonB-dependent receptor [Corallococcus sp. AB030]RUO93279.1 TonB-dependent receptor [Corallococcus sp. AB018]